MKTTLVAVAAAIMLAACFNAPVSAQAVLQGVQPCLINTAATFVCSNGPAGNGTPSAGILLGYVNNSTSAQSVTVNCYANASGVASGPIVATIPPLAAGAGFLYPGGGRSYPLGLTCVASGAPTAAAAGNGIEIYTYPGPR